MFEKSKPGRQAAAFQCVIFTQVRSDFDTHQRKTSSSNLKLEAIQ
jgi:hypothetical protein